MKIKLSDYICEFLENYGIEHIFTVVGGGAMHLNDSFGHSEKIKTVYCHHEQACAIAAEGYYRVNNKLPVVCVTTGPGGTNAITGVVGAWLDSIPMFVISGQVRYATCVRSTGLNLRAMGDQEFDITKSVSCMTKYSVMVTDKTKIKYHLKKALNIALSGRPGPVWLDIPLDIQSAIIETDELEDYNPQEEVYSISSDTINEIINKITEAKRPVINAGSAIRTSGAKKAFSQLIEKLQIPVVTGWNSIDLIENENPLYVGRAGIMGDRAGNFAIQNSDLVISLGSRLSIRQVGYNYESWAREAYVIAVDIDENELKKPTVHIDLPICTDVNYFINALVSAVENKEFQVQRNWLNLCQNWKSKYPVVRPEQAKEKEINVYTFIDKLGRALPSDQITVVGNGSACVVGSHAFFIKENSRFIINSAIASMGYDLPAAVGAAFANDNKSIICITGDGSIQMNIQELQTIVHHKLPIKIFVINNGGYHSIRQTQNKFFGGKLVGVGADSGDLSFPDLEKLSFAYGIPYFKAKSPEELERVINQGLNEPKYALIEVFVSLEQNFEPKAASKMDDNGKMHSAPLEDMFPFLSEEELKENMVIPLWKD